MDPFIEERLGCTLATMVAWTGTLLGLGMLLLSPVLAFAGILTVLGVLRMDLPTGPRVDVEAVGLRWTRTTCVEELVRTSFLRTCDDPVPDGELVARETHEGRESCRYEADRWSIVDVRMAEGEGPELGPWPEGPDDGCEAIGCRRSTHASERLYVVVERPDAWFGRLQRCQVEREAGWRRWAVGDRGTIVIGRYTRIPDCTTLRRDP